MDRFLILLVLILIPLSLSASANPFTEKAALLRYLNIKITNSSPLPPFLVSKLTPLSISDAAKFSTLAASDPFKLSSTLPSFCSAAALLCTPSLSSQLADSSAFSAISNYGNFFRESRLIKGTVMPMPDIHDRTPPRLFLPRSIAGKIPFSVAAVTEIFKFGNGTAMAKAVGSTVGNCGQPPSPGETKLCAASAEDMIDFAVSVLGSDIEVRSTKNTKGSKGNILIGEVKGVNGGKLTESVTCHQSLFPYLVYNCHAVPRVRVYEAEILAVDSKEKINDGIAICHIDTSDWSSMHEAFVELGPGPGMIEVCHWIVDGDMTWTVRDRV